MRAAFLWIGVGLFMWWAEVWRSILQCPNPQAQQQKDASEMFMHGSNSQKMRVMKEWLKGMNCSRLMMQCLQNGYKRRFYISYHLRTLNTLSLPSDMPSSFALSQPPPWATTAQFRATTPPWQALQLCTGWMPPLRRHPPDRAVFFPARLWFSSSYLIPFLKCGAPTRYWNVSEALHALTSAR